MVDITLLTDSRYVNPVNPDWYKQNILDEDRLVCRALEKKGFTVARTNWDNPNYDWTETRLAVFRTTWDYFDRYAEFSRWLEQVNQQTQLVNALSLIRWNIDKHYLVELEQQGISILPTVFIQQGDQRTLDEIIQTTGWTDCILKPAISGAARHTYRVNRLHAVEHEEIFKKLILHESMLLQEFQNPIVEKGEIAFMLFNGKFSHAVLKKAKPGDFRVQDDFGGTVHDYRPHPDEVAFAEKVLTKCKSMPVYARVDAMWSNTGQFCVSEVELIEPELWFRKHPVSAEYFAGAIAAVYK